MDYQLNSFIDEFGCNVFSDSVMKGSLSDSTYKALKKTIDEGLPLDITIAQEVADAMKDWAIKKGATHYTHWFQPLTGFTAEKHDSFIALDKNKRAIAEFSGKSLIKGESDASSFPSGGLRATFEARGYTAWDCTSPAFLKEDAAGVTLCIPTAFWSYTGVSLDKKTPLLKSCLALSNQAVRILRLFGNVKVKRVISTVGAEQEYFLIDKDMFSSRKDLLVTGRTLFGAKPPKAQDMDYHYYGCIKENVAKFMKELDQQLWKLGVPAKTKHNEVAPCQHELAPIFEEVNIATDHNQLVMETMRRVASHYNLACLLHEKPFKGLNGSGKHNNWSIMTDDGQNLLEPGKTPHENAQFLLFLCAVIKAIDEYAELLRASAANAGNDHRLGANEAPPAIVSVFIGEQLTDILEQIQNGSKKETKKGEKLDVGVSTLPALPKDSTDRNRTSPFAFTGNKFEFRMVPSSASIAGPNTVINTIVAESLRQIADRLEKAVNFKDELNSILSEIIEKHKRIIFNGNGYCDEWIREAKRRGLQNIETSADAYPAFIAPKSVELFERHNVYSKAELYARYEIKMSKYINIIGIEAKTMLEMVRQQVMPSVMSFAGEIAGHYNQLLKTELSVGLSPYENLIKSLTDAICSLQNNSDRLEGILNNKDNLSAADIHQLAEYCRDYLAVQMKKVRQDVDKIETMMDYKKWCMPTYSDLIYYINL